MFRMLHVIIFEWQFIIAKLLKLTFFRKEKAHQLLYRWKYKLLIYSLQLSILSILFLDAFI